METTKAAVLLATYNGAAFIKEQVESLASNTIPFVLHWLDDQSSDSTRDIVLSTARACHIPLVEHHQLHHMGIPSSFFRLLEIVEADVYLFCDQDDIWLPGKIDATIASLADASGTPAMHYSDTLLFGGRYQRPRSLFDIVGKSKVLDAPHQHAMFEMFSRAIAPGHTQGFTRATRELFLLHRSIAYRYAFMHDWWIHDLTIASGSVRLFSRQPTVLWRQHDRSFCGNLATSGRRGFAAQWRQIQYCRRVCARHARGLTLVLAELPANAHSAHLAELAHLIDTIDQQQPIRSVLKLLHRRAVPPTVMETLLFLTACLLSDAGANADHYSG